jgi:hypothetical protein
MPPLSLHTLFARRIAERLRLDLLDDERGNLYLGATAPDIRVITRWERSRTHFFDIDEYGHQDAVGGFFASYPALAEVGALANATQAFIAGYVSHLVMDESWINTIYRPFFGKDSELGGTLRANVLDRALQFSLDGELRSDDELMADIVRHVASCDLDLEIEFIDLETLRDWHRVIAGFAETKPDWDRFKQRTRAHLADNGADADEDCEELARSLPDLVDETLRHVGQERLDDWMNDSLERSVAAVKDYLRCA